MNCSRNHKKTDLIIKNISINQGGFGRHKCAACAYEKGTENGVIQQFDFDLEKYISSLKESQKGLRRHIDPLKAYALGFLHGLSGLDNHPIVRDKLEMAARMREFGLYTVAEGIVKAILAENNNPFAHAMSVVHVAHGFEILIKSRIVQEHPLLIFTKLPKESNLASDKIEIADLIEHGHTLMYSQLPHRLWAVTGYRIPHPDLYDNYGKTRNQIIHFSAPQISLSDTTIEYSFKVVEKAVNDWWGTTILHYMSEYDSTILSSTFTRLASMNIDTNYTLDDDGNLQNSREGV